MHPLYMSNSVNLGKWIYLCSHHSKDKERYITLESTPEPLCSQSSPQATTDQLSITMAQLHL